MVALPLRKGDVVEFDFSPSRGHEPTERRPGLVVSNNEFGWATSMALVCPITSRDNGFPLHVPIPENDGSVYGFVATEQVRAYDLLARNAAVIAHLDERGAFMRNITSLVKSFL